VTTLNINGQEHHFDLEDDAPLLWVLRTEAGLRGTKFGCGIGQCGACTVHLDGVPTRSCMLPLSAATGRQVRTIEDLGTPEDPHPVQSAWLAHQVPQCGYCQSGMQMAAAALLARTPRPSDADIEASITNICRCGCYGRIRAAIHSAAAELAAATTDPKTPEETP